MARFALLLALALGAGAGAAQAQDSVRAVPSDSAGFISRAQLRQFLSSLPTVTPPLTLQAAWEHFGTGAANQAVAAFDSARASQSTAIEAQARQQRMLSRLYRLALDTMRSDARRGLFGLSPNTADVSFDGQLQFQVGTTRQRNLACTPMLVQTPGSGCTGGFTAPTIDNTVQLTSTGVFDQRFHVNIDFDSKRDYAAGNIISAYYQGLEDEKLQRVNIGTVIFTPPPSRFLTATIPTSNFGVSATAVFGPLTVQGIVATQKGSVVATKTYTVGSGTVEPQDNLVRDLDYESGRVFWVVNPLSLPGYPAVDILNAGNISVSADSQPSQVRIYRYVAGNQSSGANANYDGITAVGSNGSDSTGALRWQLLQPNVDYWIDPSGLWFVLAARLDPSNYLAVSYRTKNGELVGTLPSTDNPAAHDALRLIYLPNRPLSSPVFPYEMRQVYRVAGSSLVRSSLQAAILVAGSQKPDSASGTYLSLLGLAVPADQATLDVDNRVFPRVRDPGASQVIKDALLVFPSAKPFSSPGLTVSVRNDSLYRTPEYLLQTQGPPSKFQLHLQFDAQGGSNNQSITLDAVQITQNSEHISVNGRPLVSGTDYTIDYNTGRVTFLNPTALFGNGTATVTASYESRDLFVQAPTSIAGLTGTLNFGRLKSISFAGLYQAEATSYTNPQIGYEPQASLLAGVTGDFTFDTPGITGFLNHLVTKRSTAPSLVQISGEFALSHPDPNLSGDAYLEDFENTNSFVIPASENGWVIGSVPKSTVGLEGVLPGAFDPADAVQLIWQNLVPNGAGAVTQLSPHDIDPTIALTQSSTPTIEPVLWTTLHADTAGGITDPTFHSHWTQPSRPGMHPRWRTMTTPLSPTGTDLSRNDYFEFAFYERSDRPVEASQMRIVVDLGTVSEDALAVAPDSFHILGPADLAAHPGLHIGDTLYTGRQYVGLGRLDTEKSSFGTWNATTADTGILADRPDSLFGPNGVVHSLALCQGTLSASITLFGWGDLSARCSNHNGFPDTEDLDGDNVLDAQGPADNVFRYVINLSTDSAKYFVRSHTVSDSMGHSATWTIYRIPLHGAPGVTVDTIGTPDIHLIKQLRLAFVTPPEPGPEPVVQFAIALMKFTGAAWISRADRPIATLSGPIAQPNGSVVVGSVSTQDSLGLGYTSPPGIGNAASTVAVSSTQFSQQINETSLRIQAFGLQLGERAEAFSRLLSGPRNLLTYRQLRVWMRGRGPGWNSGPLQAYVKVGSDAYNFYLYRAPAQTGTWNPEMVIDLQTWQDLRQTIENARLHGQAPSGSQQCGGDSTAYVACSADGSYVVQVRDPNVNPPNLAAVQELAAGMYYSGKTGAPITQTELWVDDIRVADPVSTTGYAGALNARIIASDVATFTVSGLYQDGNFHLMGQSPTYQNTSTVTSSTTMHLEKFLPLRLGLLIPASFTGTWGWVNPQLISGTDVEAAGLDGLRRPRNQTTAWSISILDPLRPKALWITRLLLNPWTFNASGSAAMNVTSLSNATATSWIASLNYFLNVQRRSHSLHLRGLTQGLPRWLRQSSAGQGIANAAYSLWPTAVQFASSLSHTMGDLTSYQVPIQTLADTILKPVTSEQFLWSNRAGLTWQPLTMLTVISNWSSTRDLRQYADSTTLGRVVNASHLSLLGTDIGVERDRNLTNSVALAPRLVSWLGTQLTIGSSFVLSRSLTTRNPVRIDGDTAGAYILPETLNNSRLISLRLSLDPRLLMQRIFGDSSSITHALVRFRPIEISQQQTLQSTFDLATFNPGLGYQLALGSFNKSFLTSGGRQALGGAIATATTATASVDLPAGFSAQLNYSSTSSDQYQAQTTATGFLETTGLSETWPSGRFSWSRTFTAGPVASLSTGSAVERNVARSVSPFNDGTTSTAISQTQRVSPNFTVVFRNGLLATVTGEVDNSNTAYSGNVTQTQSLNLTESLQWTLRMPRFLSSTRRSLQTNITVTQNSNSSCIQRTSDSSCVPYYDLSRIDVETGFTALLQRAIRTGLQFGYVYNAVRSLGQFSSTITLNMFLTIPLSSLGM